MPGLVLPRALLVADVSVQKLTLMPLLQVYLSLGFLPLQFEHLFGADRRPEWELSPLLLICLISSSVLEGRDGSILFLFTLSFGPLFRDIFS